jgi:hypothetical protein
MSLSVRNLLHRQKSKRIINDDPLEEMVANVATAFTQSS